MTTTTPETDRLAKLANRAQGGANWFYWIAGLSLLNSLVALFAGQWNFIFGLGITQVLDALAQGLADGAGSAWAIKAGGLLFSIGALSTYVLFGWLANRGKTAGYVIGMVFYALDGGIFVVAGDLLGAGFHAVALALMGRGLHAHRQLRKLADPAPESPAVEEQEISAAVASLTEDADEYETVP
ncbi:MAG: hypothetical protein GY838_18715 [bacterium]|nr:hypothetical protein [bacterium]